MMHIIATITIAIAGLIHLYIAPEHWSHAPAHGLFFGLSGAAQAVWTLRFRRHTSRLIYISGLILSGGMIVLWLFTQLWIPPFAAMAEPVDTWMITSKIAELIGFVTLVIAGLSQRTATRSWVEALGAALIGGILFYGVGYAAQPMLPMLQSLHDNHHNEMMDIHSQDEGHGDPDHHD